MGLFDVVFCLFDVVFCIMSGYPIINSSPDCIPPRTPRGKYRVPFQKSKVKVSPKISTDQPVSRKGSIKDITIVNHKEGVKEVCSRIVQDVLAGELRALQEAQSSEFKHQTLEPEHPVKTLDGSVV